jgi:hypothetical protein
LARGSTLISGHSITSALDQSRAKLDSLLSSLHHWKAAQLQQRISSIKADHASQQRALVERFELVQRFKPGRRNVLDV